MTGYLAFDRDRVDLLARRLTLLLDDLDRERLRWTDPAAAGAGDDLGSAIDALSSWPHRLARIARSGALTDLFSWSSPLGGAGIVVVRDRLPVGSAADAELAAAVLAERFERLDLGAAPPTVLAELASLLDGADPATIAAFLAEIGPESLTAILTVVRRGLEATAREDPLAGIEVPAAMALVRMLGGGLASVGSNAGWAEVWDDTELVLAAELLAGAAPSMTDAALAERSADLLGRVADLDELDPSAYWRRAGVTVLEAVALRPWAARDALVALDNDKLGFVLFRLDPGAAGAFVGAAVDPLALPSTAAFEPVSRVLGAIERAGRDEQLIASPQEWVVGDAVAADWWNDRESRFAPSDPRLPAGVGQALAAWLPWMVGPIQLAGWEPAPGRATPWEVDDDALAGALVELMASEADAAALRMAALAYFTASLAADPATQQHASYGLAAIEDSARAAGLDRLDGGARALGTLTTVIGLGTSSLGPISSALAGIGLDAVLAPLVPDIRAAVAVGEAAGFGFAASLGWAAVVAWRDRRAPDAPRLPAPPPTTGPTRPGDRADEDAGAAAAAIEEWASALTPAERDEVLALYDRVQSAAAQGTGFTG